MARPPSRPDRPTTPTGPARFGAAALRRVARVVQRAAEALAPAASSAAAVPTPEPPPRRPGQPPEHWLALVREHAPELLLRTDFPSPAEPPSPRYADPLDVPAQHYPLSTEEASPAAVRPGGTGIAENVLAAYTTRPGEPERVARSRALRAHLPDGDRAGGRIHQMGNADRTRPLKLLQRLGGGIWSRLTGGARATDGGVCEAVRTPTPPQRAPSLRLSPPATPEKFPAWTWIGPRDGDAIRPQRVTTAADWPALPTTRVSHDAPPTRGAVRHPAEALEPEAPHASPWPELPDDSALWTVPTRGRDDRIERLEREQAG